MVNLTTHFTLDEFTISEMGARVGIDNTPSAEIRRNLRATAVCLEDIRHYLRDIPLLISSGYRCPDLNKLVGGAADSAHLAGCAADFISPRFGTPLEICKFIHAGIASFPIDQLIWEFSWVHIAFTGTPRHQLLVHDKTGVHQVKFFPNEVPVA